MSCTDEKIELVLDNITIEGVEHFSRLLNGRYSTYHSNNFFIMKTGSIEHKELLSIIKDYCMFLVKGKSFHMIIDPPVPFTTLRLTAKE